MKNFLIPSSGGKRRRANFEALKKNDQVFLGFKRYNSHQIINIDNCLLLLPKLNKLITPLKEALLEVMDEKEKCQIYMTVAHNGIDLLIEFNTKIHKSEKIFNDLKRLSAPELEIIRLTLVSANSKEIVFQSASPYIIFDGIEVEVDADSFLQSSIESDLILQKLVLDFLPSISSSENLKYRVVDLFCGRGTYTIPLAKNFIVDGFEFDRKSLAALSNAVNKNNLPVNLEQRDLDALPLRKTELSKYIFAVINPPRQGALEQITELARSSIKRVCYVSCNPTTFARDAKVMINGGYELLEVTPVDQFYWSSHIEMVGYFKQKN